MHIIFFWILISHHNNVTSQLGCHLVELADTIPCGSCIPYKLIPGNLIIVLLPFLDHSYLQQEMHNIIHNQLRRYYYLISLLDMQDTTLMLVGNTVAAIAVSVDVIIVRIKLLM